MRRALAIHALQSLLFDMGKSDCFGELDSEMCFQILSPMLILKPLMMRPASIPGVDIFPIVTIYEEETHFLFGALAPGLSCRTFC